MYISVNATKCRDKEFTCDSSQCINKKYRCNGLQDCYNLTDERGCQSEFTCPEDMFQCNNKVRNITSLEIFLWSLFHEFSS